LRGNHRQKIEQTKADLKPLFLKFDGSEIVHVGESVRTGTPAVEMMNTGIGPEIALARNLKRYLVFKTRKSCERDFDAAGPAVTAVRDRSGHD
jgi:hypothetical protein